jgi:4-aminobutyrate aminotransferase-like enzyme
MPTMSTTDFWAKADTYLMHTGVPPSPEIISRAKSTRLYTSEGQAILDFTSGHMSYLLSHSHPGVVEVVRRNVGELDHLLSNMITQPVVDLAKRLSRILPAPLQKSLFPNTGSEATEAAT